MILSKDHQLEDSWEDIQTLKARTSRRNGQSYAARLVAGIGWQQDASADY